MKNFGLFIFIILIISITTATDNPIKSNDSNKNIRNTDTPIQSKSQGNIAKELGLAVNHQGDYKIGIY